MLRSNTAEMLLSTLLSIKINIKGIANFLDNVALEISDESRTSINVLAEEIISELKSISPSKPNKTIAPIQHDFAIALASAGIKQTDWAKQNNITDQALSQVLLGKSTSKRVLKLVEEFINAEFKKLKISSVRIRGERNCNAA